MKLPNHLERGAEKTHELFSRPEASDLLLMSSNVYFSWSGSNHAYFRRQDSTARLHGARTSSNAALQACAVQL